MGDLLHCHGNIVVVDLEVRSHNRALKHVNVRSNVGMQGRKTNLQLNPSLTLSLRGGRWLGGKGRDAKCQIFILEQILKLNQPIPFTRNA